MPPLTQLNPFPWEALGWSSAAELDWAPGMEGTHGKWAVLQRDSCAQTAALQSPTGLRALPADIERREEGSKRELKDSREWEDRGLLSWRKISTAFNRVSL